MPTEPQHSPSVRRAQEALREGAYRVRYAANRPMGSRADDRLADDLYARLADDLYAIANAYPLLMEALGLLAEAGDTERRNCSGCVAFRRKHTPDCRLADVLRRAREAGLL